MHDRLVLYVVIAAACGLVFPDLAHRMSPGVPVMLAGQVMGVALTLTATQFVAVARRPAPVLVTLAIQWTCLPLAGAGLLHVIGNRTVATGAVILAVVPAEITSALVAVLAAASGALASTCMAASLAAGTLLTPLWLSVLLGATASVDRQSLIIELALSVLMPLIVGVGLRTLFTPLRRQAARALDLSALSVVLVVFVAVGAARPLVLSSSLPLCVAACLALLVAGYAGGALGALALRGRSAAVSNAVVFPVAMREFGIAAAVALMVQPEAVGVSGVYAGLLMTTSPLVARRLRRRDRGDHR